MARKGMSTKAIKLSIKYLETLPLDSDVNVLNCALLPLYKEVLKYRKLKKKR